LIDAGAFSCFWGLSGGSLNIKQELRCCGNGKNGTVGRISIPYKSSDQMDKFDEEIYSYVSLKNIGKRAGLVLDNQTVNS